MRVALLLAISSLILIGCGGNTANESPETVVKTVEETVEETVIKTEEITEEAAVNCSDPGLSQAEWVENCQDAPPQGPVTPPDLSYEVVETSFFGERNGYRIGHVTIQTDQEVALSLMCEEALEHSKEYHGFIAEYVDENGELKDYLTSCFIDEGARLAYQEIAMENLEQLE